MALIKNSAVWK